MHKLLILTTLICATSCAAPEPLILTPDLRAIVSKVQLIKNSRNVNVEQQCGYVLQDVRSAASLMDAQNRLQFLAHQRGGNAVINFRLVERFKTERGNRYRTAYYFEGDAVVIN